MKVKPVTTPEGERVTFWCQGCGQFHDVDAKYWNGDKNNPTIEPASGGPYFSFDGGKCRCFAHVGQINWAHSSEHRLAGKAAWLPHEETWRDVKDQWDRNPKA